MADSTYKLAREIAYAFFLHPTFDQSEQERLAALITERLKPLVEAARDFESIIQEAKGATMTPSLVNLLDLRQMRLRLELEKF